MTAATLTSTRAALYAAGYTSDALAADRAAMEGHAARAAFDMALQDIVVGDDVVCFRTDAMRDALRHVLPDASPLRTIMRCHACDETANDCDCIADQDDRLAHAEAVHFRDAGYSAERLRVERAELMPRLSIQSREEWEAMLSAVAGGQPPRFQLDDTRYALRRYGVMRQSPMTRIATCHECGEGASECHCATDHTGHLYAYTCPECDSPCEDGEPCCSPDDDDDMCDDDDMWDGYDRGSWSGIARRDLTLLGDPEPWSPYRVGIELETDSTPSSAEWRVLRESELILGAWTDGTVRGPEIVTQPCRGRDLARVVAMLCDLRVSLASSSDPAGQQCGMHIHIDASHMTHSARRAFARLWRVVAPALHEDPDLHLRAEGGYACPLSALEIDKVIDAISDDDPCWPPRYRDCNFSALSEHGTIEVRLWGWPARANAWSPRERRAFVYRCIRRTQALRLAARLMGESRLESAHPVLALDAGDALALVESLVPLYAEV